MGNKNSRRVDALEKQAAAAGAFEKIDVTEHFQVINDIYGMPGQCEKVVIKARDWQIFTDTVMRLYG